MDAPDVCVKSLGETDANIASHFTRPEVQYVGSTSGCGHDFPHTTLYSALVETDPEWEASERLNRERLVTLLRVARKWSKCTESGCPIGKRTPYFPRHLEKTFLWRKFLSRRSVSKNVAFIE